jgi:hypothetical protein
MNRPNLILRRHGPLTFELGYFQNGVWVDHRVADPAGARNASDEDLPERDDDPIDTIHKWFSCCADSVEPESAMAEPDGAVPGMGVALQTVAAAAQR